MLAPEIPAGDDVLLRFLSARNLSEFFPEESLDPHPNLSPGSNPGDVNAGNESVGDDSSSFSVGGGDSCSFFSGDNGSWEKLCSASKKSCKKL